MTSLIAAAPRYRRAALVAGAVLLTGALAGCSSTVDSADLTTQVEGFVTETAGIEPDSVECPELDAEEGATAACTVVIEGEEGNAEVEVTAVNDDDVDFDVTLDDALVPFVLSADQVADQVSEQLGAQLGAPPEVSCPEDLLGRVGATITCVTSDGTDEYDTEVEVTSASDEGNIEFDITVAPEPS